MLDLLTAERQLPFFEIKAATAPKPGCCHARPARARFLRCDYPCLRVWRRIQRTCLALHSAHGQRAVAAPCHCTVRRHLHVLPHRQQQPGLVDGVLNNCFRRMAVSFCVCCPTASKKGRAGLSGARGGATRRESRFINRIDRPARRGYVGRPLGGCRAIKASPPAIAVVPLP